MAKRISGTSTAEDSDASSTSKTAKRSRGNGSTARSEGGSGAAAGAASGPRGGREGGNEEEEEDDYEDEDLEFGYRSAGESTDTAGGSDFGGRSSDDDDQEYGRSGRGRASRGARRGGSSNKQDSNNGNGAGGRSANRIVLSSASKALYTAAAEQPGAIARMPPTPTADPSSLVASLFPHHGDAAYLPLKADHTSRPLYIAPSHPPFIILEAFHPLSLQAQDFLTAIAEPVSRPKHVHEYKLTKHSLYAAVSIGLEPEDIIGVLSRLSKVKIPPETIDYIREATKSFGKVRLVLKDTKYYVESGYADTLRLLLKDSIIAKARVTDAEGGEELETATMKKSSLVIPGTKYAGAGAAGEHVTDGGGNERGGGGAGGSGKKGADGGATVGNGATGSADGTNNNDDELFTAMVQLDADEEADDDDNVHRFQIKAEEMENVKKRCNDLEYPMLQEYDFRADSINPNLEIALKPATQIRPYQEKSLRKMFSNE